MTPKIALSVIGIGLMVQGLIFFSFATPLTHQIFPNASDDATNVGVVMRRSLATMSFLAGLVIFLVRNETSRIAKRTLFGCSIGFAAIALSIIKEIVYNTALIPAPALAIYVLIACTSGYLALKK